MREILFRGKRKRDGVWVEGLYATFDPIDKPECIRNTIHAIVPNNGSFNVWNKYLYGYHQVHPDTIGQFIGLLDKNGKKIFEGDILERCWYVGYVERVEIRFEESSFGFHIIGTADGYDAIDDCEYGIDVSTYEVIGNIYDNPELLKKENKK